MALIDSNYFYCSCRIKSFEFPEGEVGFEIPKLLTLSDCAYRCMVTTFDHLSHFSKSYLPRKRTKEAEVSVEGTKYIRVYYRSQSL